jgi:hypothetical protein
MNGNGQYYTATEQRILDILGDGLPHRHSELWTCLNDELATRHTLSMHLTNLRKKLGPKGYGILREPQKRGEEACFRWVRLSVSPYDGKG